MRLKAHSGTKYTHEQNRNRDTDVQNRLRDGGGEGKGGKEGAGMSQMPFMHDSWTETMVW